jgi:hypothetical protein
MECYDVLRSEMDAVEPLVSFYNLIKVKIAIKIKKDSLLLSYSNKHYPSTW